MKAMDQGKMEGFLEAAGLDEEPLGMFYTAQKRCGNDNLCCGYYFETIFKSEKIG